MKKCEISNAKHQKLKNSYSLPEKLLPQLNLDSIKSENERKMDLGGPFIYGHQLNVNFSTTNSGKWEEQDNLAIWRLKVKSTGAFSLSFHFNKFFLPENAQLIIYNEGESFLYGPLSSKQNSESGKFTTGPIQGANIILELIVDKKQKEGVKLHISRIVHGFVDLLSTNSTKLAQLTCHNNIACDPAGSRLHRGLQLNKLMLKGIKQLPPAYATFS